MIGIKKEFDFMISIKKIIVSVKKKLENVKKRSLYSLYIFIILLLNLLIFITPLLISTENELGRILYSGFSFFCHQTPSHSFFLFNSQLPVCARDVGFYLGMLIGGIALPFLTKIENKKIPHLAIFILAILPLAIDGITQLIGLRTSTNELRFVTGFIAGVVIPFYLIPIVNKLKRGNAKLNTFSHLFI